MKDKYECIWIPIKNINSTEIHELNKTIIHFRKSFDICFLIGELEFVTKDIVDNDIIINIPELNEKFYKCENTVLITKNDDTRVSVQIKLEPGKITLEGLYPFESATKYELNFQFFMRTV